MNTQLKRTIAPSEVEEVIQVSGKKNSSGWDGFSEEFFQTLKK